MARNPWDRFKKSPFLLMVGSGSKTGLYERWEKALPPVGKRGAANFNRTLAVINLKILLDYLVRRSPRLLRKNTDGIKLVENVFLTWEHRPERTTHIEKGDYYFDSQTASRVRALQSDFGIVADGKVGRGTMSKLWERGRSDRYVRIGEERIRFLMFQFISLPLLRDSDYKKVA
ncbi:MAG: peptidoglycan-binding domain-containing protein [Pseudomonadota bacterium]